MTITDTMITSALSGMVGAIFGGGLVAIINGIFLRANTDFIWRSTHLSEDKKLIREVMKELNEALYLFDLRKLYAEILRYNMAQNIGTAHPDIRIPSNIEGLLNKLHLYLDESNRYVEPFYNSYIEFCKSVPELVQLMDRTVGDDSPSLVAKQKELNTKCNNETNNIKKFTHLYFSAYYPTTGFWHRVSKCLCCKST